jgi:transposase-like protein
VSSIVKSRVTKKMAEPQTQKKKRKKQQLPVLEQVQEEKAIQNAPEVTQALEELEAQGIRLDIQVCPKCKSPKVRRAKSTGGDMWGHIGLVPPSYECPDCGWQERLVLKATNKPLSVRDVELIREAMDVKDDES